jgi:bacteriorhodopsin
MSNIVQNVNKVSLVVQAITGLLGSYGLTIPLAPKDAILRQVLGLELFVQVIEFVFYLSFVSITNLKSLTQERYYDWFLSTPIMLFTISLYFFYVNFMEDKEDKSIGLLDFAKNNSTQLTWIIILNFLMLLFGFLAELGIMNRMAAFVLGTGALCGSFGIIYENYAKYSEKTRNIFWIMFGLWSIYGLAFLCPITIKNISYTILDVFAKNFFGIFLSFIISQKAV